MAGRFFSSNDLRTFEGFNKELVGDLRTDKDGLINQQIKLFKVSSEHTSTNLYGDGNASKKIVQILEKINIQKIPIQKKMEY